MLWLAVVVGVAVRLAHYLARTSLWHDESFLVLNLRWLGYRELIGKLALDQAAPPAFVLVLKALWDVWGVNELALRFVPLVGSLVALVLFARLARGWLGPVGAVWATLFFALAEPLIFHAATVKQYSTDVMMSVLLLSTCLGFESRPMPLRRLALASVIAAAGLWLSHPTTFLYAGIALVLAPELWRGGMRSRLAAAGLGVLVVASFVALYWLSIRYQNQSATLMDYWVERGSFPDYSRPWMLPVWLVHQTLRLWNYPFEPLGFLALIAGAAGVAALWRGGRRKLLALWLAPPLLVLVASLLRQFPYDGSRVTLFTAPFLCLLAAAGIEAVRAWSESRTAALQRAAWLVLIVPLIAWPAWLAADHLVRPRARSDMRGAVAHLKRVYIPGEPLYFLGSACNAQLMVYWADPPPFEIDLDPMPSAQRIWVVSSFNPRKRYREVRPMLEKLEQTYEAIERHELPGAGVIHYRRREAAATTAPTAP